MGDVVRPATLQDISAITAIYAHHVRHGLASFEWEAPSEAEMAQRMKALVFAQRRYPYVVVERDSEIAGYAYVGPYRSRAGYCYAVEDSVYVKPGFQGCGLGKLLLTTLLEESAELGFRQMVAVIGDSCNQPSIALHQALGFHYVGVLKGVGFKAGRWLDVVLMQRALGEGATVLPSTTIAHSPKN
ncbi:GNAT family N-acetyltransferase [Pseudanabaena sp. FACHB-2040]|uniref:GNAT family N-acetyltransferase n=1 Tax=Pseudanabaena sp. FACHB-2040 TaxID=2692859 RepID=UPI001682B494|nr:GNAT family N-acetyltransferase [Pseudanabaena sp. FACHB-2040]MBD2256587.1 N-acetyltransferase [Pseudanabaena sp. FACHB-2040]